MLALTGLTRTSAREGEHRAAELAATYLRQAGAKTHIHPVRVVGNYWMPLGLISALGLAAGALPARSRGVRLALAAAAALGAVAAAEDISAGRRWLRAPMRFRESRNVLGWMGPADAPKTIVICAHHDAAPSGAIFNPKIPQTAHKLLGDKLTKNSEGPPVMYPVIAAPLIAAAGLALGLSKLRLGGAALSALMLAIFTDVALRKTVPGANDNASGVVALSELARRIGAEPLSDETQVLFLSTGSEESMLEGMERFAKTHFPRLDPETTFFICLDAVGSAELCVLSGEGMLKMYHYPEEALSWVKGAAQAAGVEIIEGLRHRNSTDALYPLRAGYPTVMIGSVNELRVPANYHWRSDVEENIDYSSIEDAIALCERLAREFDQRAEEAARS